MAANETEGRGGAAGKHDPAADLAALLDRAADLLGASPRAGAIRSASHRLRARDWTALVAGLRSVGKSSFVCALWGDPDLLPTAVCDCTQTNTLIRAPEPGEADRRVLLTYLAREQAMDFAARGLAFHRLAGMFEEVYGPFGPLALESSPEARLRKAIAASRKLFRERPDAAVLHEPRTDDIEQLEQFLEFLDSPQCRPGDTVEARWEDRREHLMGKRRPDGRTIDFGRLLALRHVEIVRSTDRWNRERGAAGAPRLLDTPWVPAYHNARRADLIVEQARRADMLVILAVPGKYEFEEWVVLALRERPALARRTLVVFNQFDTIDAPALFSREGFAAEFDENRERLVKLGLDERNIFLACARLPFLEGIAGDESAAARARKLRDVLAEIRGIAAGRPASLFLDRLAAACDPEDAGVEAVRARLSELGGGPVLRERAAEALEALRAAEGPGGLGIPSDRRAEWDEIGRLAAGMLANLWP